MSSVSPTPAKISAEMPAERLAERAAEKPVNTPVGRPMARAIARIIRAIAGAGVLAAGLGVAGTLIATRPQVPRAARATPLLQVRTMEATEADVPRVWEGYGTARAMRVAQIPAQVSGTVVERPAGIEAGQPIPARTIADAPGNLAEGAPQAEAFLALVRQSAEGGVILRLDPSDYVSRLSSALEEVAATRAQLESLGVQEARTREMAGLAEQERQIQERELARLIDAIAQGGGNESEVERRRGLLLISQRAETTTLEQLDQIGPRRAELAARLREQVATAQIARQNLSRTVVTSPIAGVLQDVMFRPGEWVPAGTPIARVVDLSRIEVPVRLPIAASAAIAVGDDATLRIDSRGDRQWPGRVVRISPEADPQTRTFTVYVEVVQDADGPVGQATTLLLPGQFVIARVQTTRTERVVLVPRRAVEEDRVYVAVRATGEDGASVLVARRMPVDVLFNAVGERAELDPIETQWSAVRAGAGLATGSAIIVSNLDDLRDGLLIQTEASAGMAGQTPLPPPTTAWPVSATPGAVR